MPDEKVKGKRKFTVALLALGMSFALALFGILAGSEWVTTVGLILALYGAANGFEHFTNGK